MPEQLRALVFVLVLGSVVWLLARPALVGIVAPQTFSRWRGLWYFTTLAWFLSHSFWIYAALMLLMLLRVGRREAHVFGLYLLLLIAAPPGQIPIPGFGIVDHVFMLDHYRVLALFLLLPAAWRLSREPARRRFPGETLDWLVLAYLSLQSVLLYRGGNITNDSRQVLMLWLDLFLPYYVASRSLRDMDGLRHVLASLVLGGVLLSILAVFEVLRSWKLYDAASAALGLNTFGAYKTRGSFIRPSVTVIDSIVLGYVIVVASGAYLYLQSLIRSSKQRLLGWMALATGVLASLSRGPWVGAGLLVFVFTLSSPKPVKRMVQVGLLGIVALLLLSMTPKGQQVIDLLPFIGIEEQDNVDYRANLLAVSLPVIERTLLFGSVDYLEAPELQVMMQGEGIIDIVNSYLGVTLSSGVTGLLLFLSMFAVALRATRRGVSQALREKKNDEWLLGRALNATLVSVIFIIFTLSGIVIVPFVYFSLFGIAYAYKQVAAATATGSTTRVSPTT